MNRHIGHAEGCNNPKCRGSCDVGLSSSNALLCTVCNGTGLYEQCSDGMCVDVACDCPEGDKRVEEWLEKHPEDR